MYLIESILIHAVLLCLKGNKTLLVNSDYFLSTLTPMSEINAIISIGVWIIGSYRLPILTHSYG